MPKAYNSYLDQSQQCLIQPNMGAVGIFRKIKGRTPEEDINLEHAFIVVERVAEDGTITFWKTGFFTDGDGNGLVHTSNEVTVAPSDDAAEAMREQVFGGASVLGRCWPLPRPLFSKLEALVQESHDNPGKYNLGGNVLSSGHTAAATIASEVTAPGTFKSTKKAVADVVEATSGGAAAKLVKQVFGPVGHNCYTWARAMLHGIGIKKGLPIYPGEFFEGSRISKILPDTQKPKAAKKENKTKSSGMASRLKAKPQTPPNDTSEGTQQSSAPAPSAH